MIRIYALAKELGVDNKELVEVCQKVGLEGKRSALASLTDEDVALVKDFMQKATSQPSMKEILAGTSDAPMQRPTVSFQSGKVPVLKPTRPVKKPKEPVSEAEPIAPIVTPVTPIAEPVTPPITEPVTSPIVEPVTPPITEPVTSPIAEPVTPPIAERVTSPIIEPIEETVAPETPVISEPVQTSVSAVSSKSSELPASDLPEVDVPTRPTIIKDLTKKIPVIIRPSVKKEDTRKEVAPKKEEAPTTAPSALAEKAIPAEKPKRSPLKDLLHSGKKREEKETTEVPVPPVVPTVPVVPVTPVVPEKAPVEELSPLERARLAAARELAQRSHIIGGTSESGKKKKSKDDDKSSHSKKTVAIHLAPLPTAPEKPITKRGPKEPAPQKPEIRLGAMTKGSPLTRIMEEAQKGKGTPVAEGKTDVKGRDGKRKKIAGDINSEIEEILNNQKKGKKAKVGKRAEETAEDKSRSRRTGDFSHSHDEDSYSYYQRQHRKSKGTKTKVSTVPRKGDIVIELPCTVKDFAEATGLSVAAVIKKMMELGYMLTINQAMDDEIAEMLVEAFELKAVVKQEQSLEDQFVTTVMDQEDPPETLRPRPPVVTFLGHVDHGKTSLLDQILHMNVVSGEKGGITQHIRSYRIKTKGGDVTFVDTPGHEAFTEMRARGANCTDIAVLVVAADDGVMPQTEEAISHAKAAGVPIVVALNKMDLPGVNRDRVVQELAANDLMPSEWGGDVEIVETSAVTGMGIDALMETLLMVAELNELKARPDRPATGVAIEASLEPGQGVLCTLLVQNGTLNDGDIVLCGNAYGKVRAMFDTLDASREVESAGPSTPVTVLGFDVAPGAGSKFVVLDDISVARQIAEERTQVLHQRELSGGESHVTLENLRERLLDSKAQQTLNIIIRTDVRGSIEAIRKELSKLDHPEVKIKILQASVGGITEADVLLADASDAIIVGFNVVPDELARVVAEKKKVQIRRYDIIYKLSEDIKAALEGMLKPIEQVKELGRAFVQQTFSISRIGTIAGCRVLSGTVERDCKVRLIRDSRVIGEYILDTLKREKDDAREVREGYECGIKLKGYNDVKEGDIFEAYKIEEIARTF